ncbi:MAG: asparagine synthase (glutamine-hydrolyzing), partial [Pseudomonadota bacterium]|nr:asparagine synthase (glutamine-hydrolyzing) [Pseudomonadota bacterium]
MCGIAGIFGYSAITQEVDHDCLSRMTEAMVPRGPDGSGVWISKNKRVGFGHRRLSIIDLSEGGAQPLVLNNGRLAITFNGEIYNFRELRADLKATGHIFKTCSDTEVLLHLYDRYGHAMVERIRGMFALAIHDRERGGVFLARDGFGIKPLYYTDDGKSIRFASQVKALLAGGGLDTSPSAAGHAGFYVWGYVPEPWTMFKNIHALPAGSTLWINKNGHAAPYRYFDVIAELEAADNGSDNWSQDDLRHALLETLKYHLVADVPVGTFLSAGLDSATIVGLASEIETDALHSITLAFEEFKG